MFKLLPNKPQAVKQKPPVLTGSKNTWGSQIFAVKLALVLTKYLDYRRGGWTKSFFIPSPNCCPDDFSSLL